MGLGSLGKREVMERIARPGRLFLCAFAPSCLCVLVFLSPATFAQTGRPTEDPSGVRDVADLAQQAYEEAEQLRAEGTRPALLKAAKKYEESRRNWRLLKRGYSEAVTANALGLTVYALGETRRAAACFAQALPGLRGAGKKLQVASTLTNLGVVYGDLSEEPKAIVCFEEALALYRAEGDRAGEARALNNIGKSRRDLGELDEAKKYYEQALAIYAEVYEARDEAITLNNLGVVLWQQGEHRKALDRYERSHLLRRIAGDRPGEMTTLTNMALVYDALNEPENAKKCRDEVERLRKDPENE